MLDVLLVRSDQFRERDVSIEDLNRVPFTEQRFDHGYQRAFAEIVGAFLKGQAQQGYFSLALVNDFIHKSANEQIVAFEQRAQCGGLKCMLPPCIKDGSKILREARSAECKTRLQVSLGNVEFVVLANDVHHFVTVNSEFSAEAPDLEAILTRARNAGDMQAFANSLRPPSPRYDRLRTSRSRLQERERPRMRPSAVDLAFDT